MFDNRGADSHSYLDIGLCSLAAVAYFPTLAWRRCVGPSSFRAPFGLIDMSIGDTDSGRLRERREAPVHERRYGQRICGDVLGTDGVGLKRRRIGTLVGQVVKVGEVIRRGARSSARYALRPLRLGPFQAWQMTRRAPCVVGMRAIDPWKCVSCRMCTTICPTGAIAKFDADGGSGGELTCGSFGGSVTSGNLDCRNLGSITLGASRTYDSTIL